MKNEYRTVKPRIFVDFKGGDLVQWYSDGWNRDDGLMDAARKAIHDGRDPAEVMDKLSETFFVVKM